MSRKRELLLAIQNVGVSMFIIGIMLAGMACNMFTFLLGIILAFIGMVIAIITYVMLDRLDDDEMDELRKKRKTSDYFGE